MINPGGLTKPMASLRGSGDRSQQPSPAWCPPMVSVVDPLTIPARRDTRSAYSQTPSG